MFCSTIIPTVNRPTLARAVCSVLTQEFDQDSFEVIVVNDSGRPLASAEWQESPRVRIIHTQRHERCVARNAGAAIARGRYLHFLDDDDWLLPGGLQTLWELAQSSDADWLFAGCEIVDQDGNRLTTAHLGYSGNVMVHVMAPHQWVPMQSSLVKAESFFAVGGFHPALLVTQTDTLCRQIILRGELMETMTPAACLVRGTGWRTTTDYEKSEEYSRIGREINLNEPRVFTRMSEAAYSDFWKGRLVRIYLSSALWNWRHAQVFTGLSRLAYGFAGVICAGGRLVSRDFWGGIINEPIGNVAY